MRAIVIDGFGGADLLRSAEIPAPAAAAGEVLIRIVAAGVNPVDWKIREGLLQSMLPHRFPLIPGWDAAGTIAALGDGVADFAVGDRVWAYCRKPKVQGGTYAEYVVVPAIGVAPAPARIGLVEAASMPLVTLTSWQALFDTAGLTTGQSVLIHAGAGGIGSMAVQLAKQAGATVIATAGAANRVYVRELGADHVIDYTAGDFVPAVRVLFPEGVDVVFDTIGGETQTRSYGVLRRDGFLVSIVEEPRPEEAAAAGVRHAFVFVKPDGAQLRRIAALVDEGKIHPPRVTVMPLTEAAAAQLRSQEGHVRGKIVLQIG
ncbi:MAG: NADP-dependent oxidoreductase [Rhodospirillales bacterium]